ncbi:MAG TPA: glycoside hydrolase family 16 protein [Bacteroidia bacterium]|jgi:beta-glucanase (GH16 family)|nr:glycoside hydrolase family 16 protein [Bacteroidia bacterium]
MNFLIQETMHKFYYTILILAFIALNMNSLRAQIPVNDPAWVKDTVLSDDFHGTALNGSKWYKPTNARPWPLDGLEIMYDSAVVVRGDTLTIIADNLTPNVVYSGKTYKYWSGMVTSTGNGKFQYGYIEVKAKFPTGHRLYWTGLWFERDTCNGGNLSQSWYNEIDAFEHADSISLDGHTVAGNLHVYASTPTVCAWDPGAPGHGTNNPYKAHVTPLLSAAFHKYAIQWDANGINWYFDDTLINRIADTDPLHPTPKHGLNAVLNLWLINWDSMALTTYMPRGNFILDYFYRYTLNADCSTALTISNPSTDYYNATPKRAVKKSITTTTVGGNSPTFNLSDQCTLRATDYILLDAGTTINGTGTGQFSTLIAPCPN